MEVKITQALKPSTIIDDARRVGARISRGAAEKGVDIARALCPVGPEPPHLRDTIHAEVDERTGAATMVAGDPEQGIDYAADVEFGTVFKGPNPYFSPGRTFGQREAERLAQAERHTG